MDTLKQEEAAQQVVEPQETMAEPDVATGVEDAPSVQESASVADLATALSTKPEVEAQDISPTTVAEQVEPPSTPQRQVKVAPLFTPRLKKKVPWKGKNIVICVPRDEERGQPGKPLMPLNASQVKSMMRSWEELGYNTRGYDLESPYTHQDELGKDSQSRSEWPNVEELDQERRSRKYKVLIPDLNARKRMEDELIEAKLRALGVSLGDDEPAPPPSISPAPSNVSRQASGQYPPLPFSPPIPSSSVASAGPQGFPFPGAFLSGTGSSATQSPVVPSVASPVSFNPQITALPGKYNPRASISISPNELPFGIPGQPSPHGWSPQSMLLQQQLGRSGSPSILNLNSVVSPQSPFQPDAMSPQAAMHQRHQSLQYPILPHQFIQRQDSALASPRLQEVREVDEEVQSNPYDKSPSKTPEPNQFIRHNASASLQKEIDDAEYHLEEQFRSQLEHDDYSPHAENGKIEASQPVEPVNVPVVSHARGPSVHFGGVGNESDGGLPLHHPRPHSRGHSLTQKPFFDNDEVRDSTDEGSAKKSQQVGGDEEKADESFEIETNPSNLGTPIQSFDLVNKMHQRAFSTSSNPWANAEPLSGSKASSRRPSHGSKASFSKLNADAAEFKFNPTSNFTPSSQFVFGGANNANTFQPAPLQTTAFSAATFTQNPQSATSSHFSVPSSSSANAKANTSVPAFSPGRSDFSFSMSGPKFNPDAPAFQPFGSVAPSVTSAAASGNESASNRPTSIFSNIDLNLSDIVKPAKSSKAIPIVRPDSKQSPQPSAPVSEQDQDGRLTDATRTKKKFRENNGDNDDVPLFAEPTPEPEPMVGTSANEVAEKSEVPSVADDSQREQHDEDEPTAVGDTTFASTVLSESTDGKLLSESNDTKATTSPSATTPDHQESNWRPFEFRNDFEASSFNHSRPSEESDSSFKRGHKKSLSASLSATAKPFVPGGAFTFGALEAAATPFEPELKRQPQELPEPEPESEDDRAASPTPGPDSRPAVPPKAETESEEVAAPESEPEPVSEPQPAVTAPAGKGLGASRFASPPKGLQASRFASSPSPPPKHAGLQASRFAASPSPVSPADAAQDAGQTGLQSFEDFAPPPVSPPSVFGEEQPAEATIESVPETTAQPAAQSEPTLEEIDAVMQLINENETMGVNRTAAEPAQWHQPSPVRNFSVAAVTKESPLRLPPQSQFRSDAPSPSPRVYRTLPEVPQEPTQPMMSTELEDPFVDPPQSAVTQSFDGQVRNLNAPGDNADSAWDDAFSASEQGKLEERVQYFDGRVNDVVGNILASRLDPLEKTLESIQHALANMSRRSLSSRPERRSISAEVRESDADDEDDEEPPVPRRSMSPRKDKRMEQIRVAVMDAFNAQQTSRSLQAAVSEPIEHVSNKESPAVLEALQEIKEQFEQSMRLDLRGEDLRNIVDAAVEKRMPPTPPPAPVVKDDAEATQKLAEMQAKIAELEGKLTAEQTRAETKVAELEERIKAEQTRGDTKAAELEERLKTEQARGESKVAELEERLKAEESRGENETTIRRAAEDRSAELKRQLEQAETKVEVEIMNRSVFDQRTHDLEERLRQQEARTEDELANRREAEDRLSEIQRLLRISSEEEDRLRAVVDEKDLKIRNIEQSSGKSTMRLALLEAAQSNADKTQVELTNRLNATEGELREARGEARHWRSEAETAREGATRQTDDLLQAVDEAKHLRKLIDTLSTQMEEHERIRDTWRGKFMQLQDDMAHAAREITEENARRSKKEQALIARQEVLDARLQAESRTRERLETELERLEGGERAGLRAVSECKRLETLLEELRNENHGLQQNTLRHQRELQEANESGAAEVQRAQGLVQAELESTKQQVDAVREELEEEITRVRAQLDQVKMDADTAKAHHDMMLEEAHGTKQKELEDLGKKHQESVEDMQARYERQINNAAEDAQRAEQNLLERLSLSTSKCEHLQDRVAHLEDKVQIAQEAARAAAQAAKSAGTTETVVAAAAPATAAQPQAAVTQALQLPEKISPQALRESIMVLQEQLQAREQRIEELEQTVSKLDPEAPTKISKRDDEITWLRELLAVRYGDLQDIIMALSAEDYDREAVKNATIRLKANLQMEEQERERAMNGGSAISLPSIAATIQNASPRVAQAVGPLAAAWGNWRKANQPALNNLSNALSSPAPGHRGTPSRSSSASQSSLFSGLMTPPASGLRNTPPADQPKAQPTAFGNTGRRYTPEQFANRSRGPSMTARQNEKMPVGSTPPRRNSGQPSTPPMMRSGAYDSDAHIEEFDDAGFFDD